MTISACNSETEVSVTESESSVIVTVSTDDVAEDELACADGVTVPLQEPVGGRVVVDGASGSRFRCLDTTPGGFCAPIAS